MYGQQNTQFNTIASNPNSIPGSTSSPFDGVVAAAGMQNGDDTWYLFAEGGSTSGTLSSDVVNTRTHVKPSMHSAAATSS